MKIDWLMVLLFSIGMSVSLFYKPEKVIAWIYKKLKGTIFYPDNKAKKMGIQMIVYPIAQVGALVKFSILGFMVFKAYDIIGFEKTLLFMLIILYVTMGNINKNI